MANGDLEYSGKDITLISFERLGVGVSRHKHEATHLLTATRTSGGGRWENVFVILLVGDENNTLYPFDGVGCLCACSQDGRGHEETKLHPQAQNILVRSE